MSTTCQLHVDHYMKKCREQTFKYYTILFVKVKPLEKGFLIEQSNQMIDKQDKNHFI